MSESKIVRVVPAPTEAGPMPVAGTRLFVGDEQIRGVTRVELIADIEDGLWRAVITCLADVQEVTALEDLSRRFVSARAVEQS